MKIGTIDANGVEVSVHVNRSFSYEGSKEHKHSDLTVSISNGGSFYLKPIAARALAALLVSAIESLKNNDDKE